MELTASCPWPAACLTSYEHAALSSIHKAHVQGGDAGRWDPLLHLCALLQRSELFMLASRLRTWALQAGCKSAPPIDDSALESLGAAQLRELLANECSAVVAAHTLAAGGGSGADSDM